MNFGVQEMMKLRQDPLLFAVAVLGARPTEQQAAVLEAIKAHGSKVSVRSGHGVGKTSLEAWVILWFLSCFDDCRIPCTAPTDPQLKNILWPEIAKWHAKMHPELRNHLGYNSESVYIVGQEMARFAVARTARKENPDAFQGFHAKNLLFIGDEASGIPDSIFEASEGTMSTDGARALLAGNPIRADGYFFNTHTKHRAYWRTFQFSCLDSPLVAEDYAPTMRAKYGADSDIYRVRVLGEFPKASADTLIPLYLIESAVGRNITTSERTRKVAGLDVARFGDDANGLVVRQGSIITHIEEWRGVDTMQTVGRVAKAYHEKLFDVVHVDVIGLGAGVVDRLSEIGVPVVAVNVGEAAANGEQFSRLRDEVWWRCREFFAGLGCRIVETLALKDQLVGELSVIRYAYTSTGKIKVESKEEMKKRGIASPNLADALCLSFAEGLPVPEYMHPGIARRELPKIEMVDITGMAT